MFIDIHSHVALAPVPVFNGLPVMSTAPQILALYKKCGVEKAVILPLSGSEYLPLSQSMAEILLICKQHRGKFVPFMNFDPRNYNYNPSADLSKLMLFYMDQGMKGIGEITSNLHFLDPYALNLFKHAEKCKLPVLFHVSPQLGVGGNYGLYDQAGLPFLERALQLFPKLTFIGHSQAFWAEMGKLETSGDRFGYPKGRIQEEGAVPKLLRKYGNLHADLSAGSGFNSLNRDKNYAAKFLAEFQDKVYFGADVCCPLGVKTIPLCGFLLELKANGSISKEVFEKVARGNAQRLLKLK